MPPKPKRALSLVKKTDQNKSGSDKSGSDLVLVVEDNEVLRRLFLSQLKVIGLVGHEAVNGKEAVETVAKGQYGLILMDVSMPVMDGLEATKLIREAEQSKKLPRVPIIAVTGISDRDTCLQSGMDDFMNKPFLLEHLRGVVAKWMKHRA
ncbi:MAG: response regulator [Cyanobacteria bacterium SZAS-4]|nr:response regulator [Cyanobacteria bacterium SZAS-4]